MTSFIDIVYLSLLSVRNTNLYWPKQSASPILYRLLAILRDFFLYCAKFSPYGMAPEVSVADPSQIYDLSPTQTFRMVNSFLNTNFLNAAGP